MREFCVFIIFIMLGRCMAFPSNDKMGSEIVLLSTGALKLHFVMQVPGRQELVASILGCPYWICVGSMLQQGHAPTSAKRSASWVGTCLSVAQSVLFPRSRIVTPSSAPSWTIKQGRIRSTPTSSLNHSQTHCPKTSWNIMKDVHRFFLVTKL